MLLTGFLGSGKTTFLNNLLKQYRDKKTGLLINDFGQVPIDGAILRETIGEEESKGYVYEIGNGSIFCSCLQAPFILGLRYFSQTDTDILFIETSGLSDPSGFSKIITEAHLDSFYTIRSIVCLVDASRHAGLSSVLEAPNRQVLAADLILVNKVDLVDEQALETLDAQLKSQNGDAKRYYCSYGNVEIKDLLEQKSSDHNGEWESCNTPGNKPKTLFLETSGKPMETIKQFISSIIQDVYRIKGIVSIEGVFYSVSDDAAHSGSVWKKLETSNYQGRVGITVFAKPEKIDPITAVWRAC